MSYPEAMKKNLLPSIVSAIQCSPALAPQILRSHRTLNACNFVSLGASNLPPPLQSFSASSSTIFSAKIFCLHNDGFTTGETGWCTFDIARIPPLHLISDCSDPNSIYNYISQLTFSLICLCSLPDRASLHRDCCESV